MTIDFEKARGILATAISHGSDVLLETEGLHLLEAMGIPAPAHHFVKSSKHASRVPLLAGDKVVVKVISREILHKSDVGGVEIIPNKKKAIQESIAKMEERFHHKRVAGYTINQFISYDRSLGGELLLGMMWAEDFGPVVTFGPGGVYTEFLSQNFKVGRSTAMFSPGMTRAEQIVPAIQQVAVTPLITGMLRGQKPRIEMQQLVDIIQRMMAVAGEFAPELILEFEMNPIVISEMRIIALDVLVKLGSGQKHEGRPPRPIHKIKNLLEPESAAIMGVSERLNPGHIILNNLIREGFAADRIYVIKPGTEQIEGCKCYPSIEALPEKVDLAVLSISAAQVPEAVSAFIEKKRAESIIIIPGGLGEKEGSEDIVTRMQSTLLQSRAGEWEGPVLNGGNCLGIRSRPGHYDTMFIPEYKLPAPAGPASPVALISQSGAFAISRSSKLGWLSPKYSITVGNQVDLTIGDYLTYLKDDHEIELYAVYVEGFRPDDGLRFLRAARDITDSGRTVILYRAGRTTAGARASASHTASIAGDYTVTRGLAGQAGVVVVETISDFEDLIKLFAMLHRDRVTGWRLGAVSNAGFECVAIADNLGAFELRAFVETTSAKLRAIFQKARIDEIVDVHNPLDLTPMASDAAYEDAVNAVLGDENVDIGVVGCVPLSPAINTRTAGKHHAEDIMRSDSFPMRMARLKAEIQKPWIIVVDSGELYDPMASLMEINGIPAFREADRAMKLFNIFCKAKIGTKKPGE